MSKRMSGLVLGLIVILALGACGTADPAPSPVVEESVDVGETTVDEPQGIETTEEVEVPEPEVELVAPEGKVAFKLDNSETEARFTIGEVLRGEPTTVVGSTSAVSGAIFIDLEDPEATEVSVITVEAGTLRTDNNFRNRAIRDFILQTGRYPTITFTPTAIEGLPSEVAVGDSFTFEVIGDLTIREITQEVVFSLSVTAESESAVRGTASTTVLRQDFDLRIPSVPQVAGVEPQVLLELDFLAIQ